LGIRISDSKANKLQEGPPPLATPDAHTPFWTFIAAWGGRNWMWGDIDNSDTLKDNIQWVMDRMIAGTLIWTTNGSYDRNQAADLSGVGWIIFCKANGQRITGSFWE
jgi:hypothetical protein